MPNTASVSDLQRHYARLLRKVKETKEPIVLLKDNHAEAALLDINQLEEFYMIKRDYEEQVIKKALASFRKAERAGKLLSATSAKELFKMVDNEVKNPTVRKAVPKKVGKIVPKRPTKG